MLAALHRLDLSPPRVATAGRILPPLPLFSASLVPSLVLLLPPAPVHAMRHSLHIRIDPSPYDSKLVISPDSTSPSPGSALHSNGTSRTTPSSSASDHDDFSVLCIYDFQAADRDQLSFRKNEILSVVKREDTGWWAAMHKGGDVIGWVPQAFVKPLSEEMADRLINVREELRIYEYSAEQLYLAPISRNEYIFESDLEPSSKHSKVGSSILFCCIRPVQSVYSYRPGPSNYRSGTTRKGVRPRFSLVSAVP